MIESTYPDRPKEEYTQKVHHQGTSTLHLALLQNWVIPKNPRFDVPVVSTVCEHITSTGLAQIRKTQTIHNKCDRNLPSDISSNKRQPQLAGCRLTRRYINQAGNCCNIASAAIRCCAPPSRKTSSRISRAPATSPIS